VCTIVDLTEAPEVTFDGLAGWLAEAGGILGASEGDTVGAADHAGIVPPDVRLILGVHPHNASAYDAGTREVLRAAALAPHVSPVAGLGELGLDFHYDHSPRDAQRAAFRGQLALAHELGLPVTVHLREAHDEGLAILAEGGVPAAGCVIHCFTEGPEMAQRFLGLSEAVCISIAGPVTFAKAVQVREALHVIPLDRMLLETDSPFLAPAPYRGESNEPAFTVVTAAKVAEVLGVEAAVVASRCLDNARRIFVRRAPAPEPETRP
jgi:TatD DNase family protein